MTKYWTDYPILALGDESGKEAPIRECEVLGYDGDKYARIRVGGVVEGVKLGYIYTKPSRCGDGHNLRHTEAEKLFPHMFPA